MNEQTLYSAFANSNLLFRGPLSEVVLKVKKSLGKAENSSILIFSDATGKTMDFNFQGSERDVLKRLEVFVSSSEAIETTGPGRPKLGVVSREVSLLPRHWEWLATQSGGASATLRTLIEEAKKKSSTQMNTKQLQERAYKFMSVMAGDLRGFEEALRALYKKDRENFLLHTKEWPRDIKNHVAEMTKPIFE
ncbi:MAG: DUF2239 family protein [Bdellovibrionota bacterium]